MKIPIPQADFPAAIFSSDLSDKYLSLPGDRQGFLISKNVTKQIKKRQPR
jgi:hypothetical protein